jgi:hypothetical protein
MAVIFRLTLQVGAPLHHLRHPHLRTHIRMSNA